MMTRHKMGFSVMWRAIYRISTLNIGFMPHFANIGEENTFIDGGETLLLLFSPSDLKLFAKSEMTIEKIIPSALLRICFSLIQDYASFKFRLVVCILPDPSF